LPHNISTTRNKNDHCSKNIVSESQLFDCQGFSPISYNFTMSRLWLYCQQNWKELRSQNYYTLSTGICYRQASQIKWYNLQYKFVRGVSCE
jgi:hypothetical protein